MARSATPPPKAKPLPSKESEEPKKPNKDKESVQDKKAPKKFDADKDSTVLLALGIARKLIKKYPARSFIIAVLIAATVLQKLGYMGHTRHGATENWQIQARHNCVVFGPTPDMSSHSMAYSYGFKILNILLLLVWFCGMVVYKIFHPVLLLKELLLSVPMIAQFYDGIVSALTESMAMALRGLLSFIPEKILDSVLGPVIGLSILVPILLTVRFWETHKNQIASIGSLCTFAIAIMVRTYGLQATLKTIELAVVSPIQFGSGMLAASSANLSYWWALATLRIVC